jgi:ligand-binding SRPBCC domain-containing protein
MAQFTLTRRIAAPPAAVFAVVADVERMPARIPEVKKIEVLTAGPVGVGTKFRETRIMFGKEASETFEVVECDPGRRLTLVAVSCGAEYRCEHRFVPDAGGTVLELEIRTRALTLFARLMAPLGWLMAGVMKKAIAKDLDAVARAAEGPLPQAA